MSWTALPRVAASILLDRPTTADQRHQRKPLTMSQTSPPDEKSGPREPTTKSPLLDPATFEAFAAAAKRAVAEGLGRRALMAQKPPSNAKH